MADDGGVQAKLDSAKAALSSAQHSNISGSGPSYSAARAQRKEPIAPRATAHMPTTADELKAKADNVNQYAAAQ